MIFTIDVPGDGPTRAVGAYAMFLSPHLITDGVWLPGYSYLHSLFYLVLENPAVTPRIVNVILGALTVPLFYLLIAKVFNRSAAMISALLLIFLPIHIGLSASSLTEPTFLFEFIGGSLFLILAANREKYHLAYLLLAVLLLSLAITTRYEGWLLIPIFVIYYFVRSRSIAGSFLLATFLLTYPILWTIGNHLHSGDPFLGFTIANGWFHGAKPVGWLEAIIVVSRKFIYHLGWILPLAMVVGIALQLRDLLRKQFTLEQIFYLSATIMYALGIFRFAIARGNDLWDRYLVFGFVLMLPFAVVPVSYFAALRSKAGVAAIAFTTNCFCSLQSKIV
jgi:4-amino-4-deoxy-L-arabinose transferase-like glycosyltransferase